MMAQSKRIDFKILLFQPPSPPFMNVGRDWAGGMGTATRCFRKGYGHEGDIQPYISLMYNTSILGNNGYYIAYLDGQAENLNLAKTLSRIKEIKPHVIVSVVNLPSLYGDLELLSHIKREISSVTIIGIGTVCKALPEQVLKDRIIDYAITGEPEIILPKLLENLERKDDPGKIKGIAFYRGNQIYLTLRDDRIVNLNDLPTPSYYYLMPLKNYWCVGFGRNEPYMTILTSKGCPYKCSYYCPYPFGFGEKVAFREPLKVVDEMELLYKDYDIKNFLFRDQNFTINSTHTETICEEIIRRNLKIRWICETRPNLVNQHLLRLMKEAGCIQINYGFETGDPDLFTKVGKPGIGLQKVADAVKITESIGIQALLHTIVGLPGESLETFQNTINTLRNWNIKHIGVAVATPYPGTRFFEDAQKCGYLLTLDWSKYTGMDPVIKTDNFTAMELKRLQSDLEDTFDPNYPERPLKKIITFFHKLYVYAKEGTLHDRLLYKIRTLIQYLLNPNRV